MVFFYLAAIFQKYGREDWLGPGNTGKDTEGPPPLPLVEQMAVRCLWLQSVRI